jgi:hemerythrin-like domain-containing protein
MPSIPQLLNTDGTASMATMLMLSHHAFRRDIARFARALTQVAQGDASRNGMLQKEWQMYRGALHGHHHIEDTAMFPDLKTKHPEVAAAIDELSQDHHQIDPLLDTGDKAFQDLANPTNANAVIAELKALLDAHLAHEESTVTPFLRDAKEFPVPKTDEEATMYAGGFAWSMHGIAPHVQDLVRGMLPENVRAKLPQAEQAFTERCAQTWGVFDVGKATTPIPDGYV